MMIRSAGRYHYTEVAYTCDGDKATDEEVAELRAKDVHLQADGWQRIWSDDTGKGVLVVYRRDAAADPDVTRAFERRREAAR